MSSDMTKVARHFVAVNRVRWEERETDSACDYKITAIEALVYNTITTNRETGCQFSSYKGMHSITFSLFLFKVYIALNYCESNNQHAHAIPGSDSIKINLALVPFL